MRIETTAVVINDIRDKEKIVIGYVGGIRYFDINSSLLKQFSNNSKFELFYAGRANLDCDLENFCRINKIYNVRFIGAFNNDEKFNLYKNVDIINAIYGNNSLEVTTALPNRLYDAAILRKPILVSVGTYVAKVVEEYELGLAVDVNKDVVKVVGDYVKSFDAEKFELNCHKFLNDIKKEQDNFIKHIEKFVTV